MYSDPSETQNCNKFLYGSDTLLAPGQCNNFVKEVHFYQEKTDSRSGDWGGLWYPQHGDVDDSLGRYAGAGYEFA